jgi:hypothetical protein
MGPTLCSNLRRQLRAIGVGCQGVGGSYSGALISNIMPGSTSKGGINEAKRMFNMAASRCPNTKILAGGYSYVHCFAPVTFLTIVADKVPRFSQEQFRRLETNQKRRSREWCSLATQEMRRTEDEFQTFLPIGSKYFVRLQTLYVMAL